MSQPNVNPAPSTRNRRRRQRATAAAVANANQLALRASQRNLAANRAAVSMAAGQAPRRRNPRSRGSRGRRGSTTPQANQMQWVQKYLACMVDPCNFTSRIPNAYPHKTALFRSRNTYDIPVSLDQYNGGRFSAAISPKLGDTSATTRYQMAIVDQSRVTAKQKPWSQVNWADPTLYCDTGDFATDPRLDTNTPFLTTPPPFFWGASYEIATSTDLSAQVLVSGIGTIPDAQNYGTPIPTASPASDVGFSSGVLRLPIGEFLLTLEIKYTVTAGAPINTYLNFIAQAGTTVLGLSNPQSTAAVNNTVYNNAATYRISSTGGQFLPVLSTAQAPGTTNATLVPNSTVTTTYATVTPAYFGGSSTPSAAGVIQEVRPVAMSVLASYSGPELTNGGQICGALVSASNLGPRFFNNATGSGVGQLQLEENLRKVDPQYNGALKDGVYVTWQPYDDMDSSFMSPTAHNGYAYPAIIISGIWAPGPGVTATQTVVRLEMDIVYEIVTQSTALETTTTPGSTAMHEMALNMLRQTNPARANGEHLDWIKGMISKAANFYRTNSTWINPLATSLAALAI